MSDNNGKTFFLTVAAGLAVYAIWETTGLKQFVTGLFGGAGSATNAVDTTGGGGAGTGGAGGSGGTGGGVSDYTALAAAINALAAGVAVPNIKSVTVTLASGDTEVVPALNGQRVCILGYALSGTGTITAKFRSGNKTVNLWELDLDIAAGNTGATQSTAFPSFLFATDAGDALTVNCSAGATLSVSYWQEIG